MDKRLIILLCLFLIGARPVNVRCPMGQNINGLVALWNLDVDEDPISEPIGNHTGAQAGNPANVTGYFSNCERFDGSGDYFEVADHNDFTFATGLTITMWLKGTGTSPDSVSPFGKRDVGYGEWYIYLERATDRIGILILDETNSKYLWRKWGNYGDGEYIEDGTWHFYAWAWNGGTADTDISIYADGVKRDDTNAGSGDFVSMTNTPDKVNIGRIEIFPTAEWDGDMDDVAIFNRELSAAEIKHIYYKQERKYCN